ncbi:TonB-dependent receptor precursor [Sphingomonas paucimobilis]|nr:TonB-dependent receptor precursor [Sphingomonas paucimobilis]
MTFYLRAGVSFVALGLAGMAHAQGVQTGIATQMPDSASSRNGPVGIEDIVVTAQRRSESLQRVPITVSAVTADTVQALGITNTADLSAIAPSFTLQTQIGNATPFIRGVGTQAAGSPGQENSVAIYVDGVYISAQAASIFALNSIERIEVLKGPQSTLFGRNATGGLIQIITREPSHDTQIEGTVGYGNYQTFNAKLYATTGLSDKVAIDFAGSYSHQGKGWGTSVITGRDANKTPLDLALRSKLLFTPTDTTRITFAADYARIRTTTGISTRTAPGSVNALGYSSQGGFYDTSAEQEPIYKAKSGGLSLKIEQEADFAQFVSITAFRESRATSVVDFLSNPQRGLVIALNPHERQFTQELQILSPEGSDIKWIGGLFYYRNKGEFDPFEVRAYPALTHAPGPVITRSTGQMTTDSISAFAQATFPLGKTTRLTTGIRYTRDKREATNYEQVLPSFAPPGDPIIYPVRRSKSSKPTWRISLDQDLGPNVLGYASYNRGFKSGLYNLQEPLADPLKPEKIDAYEVGLKADLFNRMLRLNIAGFYYDYTNLQLLRAEGGKTQLLNASSAKIYGLDFEGTLVPVEGLTLRAGVGLLHSRYGDFPNAVQTTPIVDPVTGLPTGGNMTGPLNAKGNHTVFVPDYTINVSAAYERRFDAGTLGATVGYYYSGRRYFEIDNRLSQDPYGLLSAELSWTLPNDHLRVRVWGRNLANEKVFRQITEQAVIDGVIADAPRTYGAALDFRF